MPSPAKLVVKTYKACSPKHIKLVTCRPKLLDILVSHLSCANLAALLRPTMSGQREALVHISAPHLCCTFICVYSFSLQYVSIFTTISSSISVHLILTLPLLPLEEQLCPPQMRLQPKVHRQSAASSQTEETTL